MKRHSLVLAMIGTAALLGGCQSAEDRAPITGYLDSLDQEVTSFEQALAAHAADVKGAQSLATAMDMEKAHAADAQMRMDEMGAGIDHMDMCTNPDGHSPDTGGMHQLAAGAMKECERHDAAMQAAGDMMSAQEEENQHQATMADLLTGMKQARDQMADQEMMAGAGMHMCDMGASPAGDGMGSSMGP
jgi:hypothetical protein